VTVLLFATTTGYQTRAFEQAAAALGIDLLYATDRCHLLDDPWRDRAIPVRYEDEDASLRDVLAAVNATPHRAIGGVIAVGDRPTVLAARVARELRLPWHGIHGVRVSRSKLMTRGRLIAADLPVPWFFATPLDTSVVDIAARLRFPCVVKPLALSGSRGVMRANSVEELEAALVRLRELLMRPEILAERPRAAQPSRLAAPAGAGASETRALREPMHDEVLVEGFIEGREYALEGVLEEGALRVLAIFDKPDPLDGPFFEETIYVTPTSLPEQDGLATAGARTMASTVAHAAAAMGLRHGPVHAECRINDAGVFVLEIAARPIGGLCARALRFSTLASDRPERDGITLEELLLRQATGESLDAYGREARASAVMMIPIPRRGFFKSVTGAAEAAKVDGIEDVVITAKPDQLIEPLPEGSSYLGFIFARADQPEEAVAALRAAHARLQFRIDPDVRLVGW
jgi:biotin carboxylase